MQKYNFLLLKERKSFGSHGDWILRYIGTASLPPEAPFAAPEASHAVRADAQGRATWADGAQAFPLRVVCPHGVAEVCKRGCGLWLRAAPPFMSDASVDTTGFGLRRGGGCFGAGLLGVFGAFGTAPFFESAGASSASKRQKRAVRIVTQGLPRVGAAASATK